MFSLIILKASFWWRFPAICYCIEVNTFSSYPQGFCHLFLYQAFGAISKKDFLSCTELFVSGDQS